MLPIDNHGARKAALLLHAMPTQGRTAVLQALSEEQSETLQALLTELQALGIPPERDWLSLIDAAPATPANVVEQVTRLDATDVRQRLSSQSLDTVAAFIASQEWPWEKAVVHDWPLEERALLVALIGDAPCLTTAACESIAKQLLLSETEHKPVASDELASQRTRWYQRFFPVSQGPIRSRP